ncbi:SNase-like protein [Indivirus ILV1]|uniref:SNase-like protein n=1 Tax=Indivirus ILV1 TaxID=1977633 RepID=A0A1V0SCN3_9VIRU|nr:SNase-like protein [Indivirus ILV1]
MTNIKIIETIDELEKLVDCPKFSLNGEVHLGKVISCYDGDTCRCIFKYNNEYKTFTIRMYGYDSPEMKPSTSIPEEDRILIKNKALDAKHRLETLILNQYIYIYCMDFDKYGRLLANIKLNIDDKKYINEIMVEEEYGYPYFGGTKRELYDDYSSSL